ncbi:hypothetical protein DASC09_042850 [Saccharomycopsis crataegensis]|uniref:Rhodanese domain-containing protein n=1 Tax=Saccharomycopsis crataegensis TaxID=43959 RepID=A0AAV5QQZ7_9ASCO|nr:hypothetical protein DASC09_042850 [Saccharomycopsis crataegensis]
MPSGNKHLSVQDWLGIHPNPTSVAARISHEQTLKLLQERPDEIAILDLRNDRSPGFLKESINIPATSLNGIDEVKKELIDPMKEFKSNLQLTIVHCNSSKNRATKVAGWIQDYINENNIIDFKVSVLDHGINGWFKLSDPVYKSYIVPI